MMKLKRANLFLSLAISFLLIAGIFQLNMPGAWAMALPNATISGGQAFSLMISSDGTLLATGLNNVGQLGNGTLTRFMIPTAVTDMSDVVYAAAGFRHAAAIKSNGILYTWGSNATGQLGDNTKIDRKFPAAVPGMTDVAAVAAGYGNTFAIKKDGTLYAWGMNGMGKLGIGSIAEQIQPKLVENIANVAAVSAGETHTLAVTKDGTLYAWGANNYGQYGNGSTVSSLAPVKIMNGVVGISAGKAHSLILKADGTLLACGHNGAGQLGNGSTATSFIPVEVMKDVQAVSANLTHSAAITSNGDLYAWGSNQYGILGAGTDTANRIVPVKIETGVAAVSAGAQHTLVLMKSGTLRSTGLNNQGQLGDNTMINRFSLVTVQVESVQLPVYTTLEITPGTAPVQTPVVPAAPVAPPVIEPVTTPVTEPVTPPAVVTPTPADVTPEPVTGANAIEVFDNGIHLSWTGTNEAAYQILRSDSESDPGESITEDGINSNVFADVNLEPNTTYYYTVKPVLEAADPDIGKAEVLGNVIVKYNAKTGRIQYKPNQIKKFMILKMGSKYLINNGSVKDIYSGENITPAIINSRVMVPIRAIVETLGGTVGWDESLKQITMNARGNKVIMWLNSTAISANGMTAQMDVAPQIINNRTFVPVRFAAENFDCQVDWLNSLKEVVVVYDEAALQNTPAH